MNYNNTEGGWEDIINLSKAKHAAKLSEERFEHSQDHYKQKSFEPREVISEYELGFNLGNVIKYVLRCEYKGQKESDLIKAIDYLKFELEELNKNDLNG